MMQLPPEPPEMCAAIVRLSTPYEPSEACGAECAPGAEFCPAHVELDPDAGYKAHREEALA